MLTITISDHAIPGNVGRGYVLRRILRRAARYGKQYLGQKDPFIYRLVDTFCESMGDIFPEIQNQKNHVKTVIQDEEEGF